MGAFSQYMGAASRKAPRVVKLRPNGFADTWAGKPACPVDIGLRLVADVDLATADSVAAKRATDLHPGLGPRDDIWVERYNQALMHWAIARGTCQPDDVDQSYWEMAEDVVPAALSEHGTLRLYSELEILTMTESVVTPEIDDDGLARLAALLQPKTLWIGKTVTNKRRIGRLLTSVLEMIEPPQG